MNRIKALGLVGLSLLTLCSCGNETEWKYPEELYVEYVEYQYGGAISEKAKRFTSTTEDGWNNQLRYTYDGNTLEVRQLAKGGAYIDGFSASNLGKVFELKYEYGNCRFWATFKMEEKK